VRQLIPGIAPGATMEDIVLAPFDYAQLDRAEHEVRHSSQLDGGRRAQCRVGASRSRM
jgi:hypothetical protein